jgi:CheY-like chemotaxis protein
VDDEPYAREVVALILVQASAQVTSAADVGQAIGVTDQWRPDVLISDLGMPGEDGYDLIRKVRARPAEKQGNIPAIALTALGRIQDRLKVLSAGYQMHVPKPIEPIRACNGDSERRQETLTLIALRRR